MGEVFRKKHIERALNIASQINKKKDMQRVGTVLSIFTYLFTTFFVLGFPLRNNEDKYKLSIKIAQTSNTEIAIVLRNISNQKYYVISDYIIKPRCLTFDNSPEVRFNGWTTHYTTPFYYNDTTILHRSDFLERDCYIKSFLKENIILLPGDTFEIKYNFSKDYIGFIPDKEYSMCFTLAISNEYSLLCPLIWSGVAISNSITWKYNKE